MVMVACCATAACGDSNENDENGGAASAVDSGAARFGGDLPIQLEELVERPRDDQRVGSRRCPVPARIVMDADLRDAKARLHGAGQDLGADHGPFGLRMDHIEDPPIEELEGTIDVT